MNEIDLGVKRQESGPLLAEEGPVEKPDFSVQEIQRLCDVEEEMGYDAPFVTLTWARWLEMQATMLQGFTRYQRAIEQRQAQLAGLVVIEMQQVAIEMQKEACAWIGRTGYGVGESRER